MNDKVGAKGLQLALALVAILAVGGGVMFLAGALGISGGLLESLLMLLAVPFAATAGWGLGATLNRRIEGAGRRT